jgi:putative PIN family toxin of toxin-antitoxin system
MFWPRICPIRKKWSIESKAWMAPARKSTGGRRLHPIGCHRFLAIDAHFGIMYDTIMAIPGIVIDTNVFVAALRSRQGASYRLLTLIDSGLFAANISVPLILEYEEVAKRMVGRIGLTAEDIDDILDYICRVAKRRTVFYLWRPLLRDPQDDMILELAVVGNCSYIITYNQRDFQGAERFGIRVATPKAFLQGIGVLP